MAASGKPTPQPERAGHPRFQDRLPHELERPEINPFLTGHRDFGRPLLPASEAWRFRGRWAELFGRDAPLHVEIGSGNGFFLSGLGQRNPEWNVLGIELRFKRTVLCARKIREVGAEHTWIARYHAAFLDDLFEDGALSGLYVNHPDPWPKVRHEKNRLISRWFLDDVVRLLRPGGLLRLKSDFKPNVDRVEQLLGNGAAATARLPLAVTGRSDDVRRDGAPWPDDITTNYQRKMDLRGLPVHALEVLRLG